MSPEFKLEQLGTLKASPRTVFLPSNRLDNIRATAQNLGYAQGYATARAELDASRAETALLLATKIQNVTTLETNARKAMLETLRPLIEGLVNVVLPNISASALADTLTAEVMSIAARATAPSITLSCAPENVAEIQRAVSEIPNMSDLLKVTPRPHLGLSEVLIKSAAGEICYDPEKALRQVQQKITSYFSQMKEMRPDG